MDKLILQGALLQALLSLPARELKALLQAAALDGDAPLPPRAEGLLAELRRQGRRRDSVKKRVTKHRSNALSNGQCNALNNGLSNALQAPSPLPSPPAPPVSLSSPRKPNPKEKPSKEGQKKSPFLPPTTDAVEAFAERCGLTLDAGRFVDYYAAQGWRLSNGNPMKDWEAAARNWARRNKLSNGVRCLADWDALEDRRESGKTGGFEYDYGSMEGSL